MKFTLKQRMSLGWAAMTGQWEGSEQRRTSSRPMLRNQSVDEGMDYGTREKMTAEARGLCQVFPLAVRILRKYANYIVGPCDYEWDTGDPAVDKAYEDYWSDWKNRCDVNGRHKFPALARIAVMSRRRDGDMFVNVVPGGMEGEDILLRLVEADRVGNYKGGTLNIDEPPKVVGGCVLDATGRTIAYRVNDRATNRGGSFVNQRDIPGYDVVHYFDSERADGVRGVTSFYAVLNTLRDFKNISDALKSKTNLHARLTLLAKSIQGAAIANVGGMELLANPDSTTGTDAKVNVQEVGEQAIAYMFPNEDMKAFESNQPSGETMAFLEFIVQLIAIGMDLPKSVVWSMAGLTGPGARAEMNDAARTFDYESQLFEEKFCDPIVGRVISNAMARGLVPEHPNWHVFSRLRPAKITIDIGKDVAAGLKEYDRQLTTAGEWMGEEGKRFRNVTSRWFKEERIRMDEAKKNGVPYFPHTMINAPNNAFESADDKRTDGKEEREPAQR
jgi:lambda family phage portal protein